MNFDIGSILRKVFQKVPFTAYLFIPVIKLKDILQTKEMHKDLTTKISIFCSEEEKADPACIRRMKRDAWYCFLRYDTQFFEYFYFDFPRLSHYGRMEFIMDNERGKRCMKMTSPESLALFKNKWNAYQTFREFYKRDALLVDAQAEFASFCNFAQRHPRFIVKPLEASFGRDVRLLDTTDADLSELFAQLQQERVILEEQIVQCAELARLHPASVNTVRCATFVKDGVPEVLFAFLRVGRGNSLVDNAGAGGLQVLADLDTGILDSPGITEFGESYLIHPDTGVQLLGMVMPRWEEMKETAKKAAMVVPEQKYVGWDMALTDDGWVIVEGNCAGQLQQITTIRGLRKQYGSYFGL